MNCLDRAFPGGPVALPVQGQEIRSNMLQPRVHTPRLDAATKTQGSQTYLFNALGKPRLGRLALVPTVFSVDECPRSSLWVSQRGCYLLWSYSQIVGGCPAHWRMCRSSLGVYPWRARSSSAPSPRLWPPLTSSDMAKCPEGKTVPTRDTPG